MNTFKCNTFAAKTFALRTFRLQVSGAVGRDDDPVSKFIDITDKEARQMLVAVMRTFDW